jgi:hypothetical protein
MARGVDPRQETQAPCTAGVGGQSRANGTGGSGAGGSGRGAGGHGGGARDIDVGGPRAPDFGRPPDLDDDDDFGPPRGLDGLRRGNYGGFGGSQGSFERGPRPRSGTHPLEVAQRQQLAGMHMEEADMEDDDPFDEEISAEFEARLEDMGIESMQVMNALRDTGEISVLEYDLFARSVYPIYSQVRDEMEAQAEGLVMRRGHHAGIVGRRRRRRRRQY